MLSALLNPRPKSTSNVIENSKSESKAVQDLSEDNRFRTYNVKDLKMAKAYLPQDVIREFKEGFEASLKSPSTSKSRNFVRKLVATLESKKDQGSGHCTADDEFVTKCFRTPRKNALVFEGKDHKTDFFEEQFAVNIKNLSQSIVDDDDKNKNCDNVDEVSENELKAEEFMKICSLRNFEDLQRNDIFQNKVDHYSCPNHLPHVTKKPSSHNEDYDRQNVHLSPDVIYAEPKNKRSSIRRTAPVEEKRSFKNVLSSLMGIKKKSVLPKGKRNILSPKDSLGEEMRLFRRDMMPGLLRAAQPYNSDTDEKLKDETFSSIIAASRPKLQSSDRNASIHPFYRGKKSAPTFLQTLEEENVEPQGGSSSERQKCLQQDMEKVVLREKKSSLYERPPAVIYDVPKNNKRVHPSIELKKDRENFINYENTEMLFENNWNKNSNVVQRNNIVCGKRALYMRHQRLETEF